MACVAVTSLVRTIELELLQSQPRPVVLENQLIFDNKDLIESLHKKLGFLMELFDENRMDGVEAIRHLETKLRDVALRVEDEIELRVVHLYEEEEEEEEEEEFGVAGLFLEKPEETQGDIIEAEVEKPHGNTDEEKSLVSLKLCRILQEAIEEIDVIKDELVKVKKEYQDVIGLQGRKTTLDSLPKSDEVITMGDSSQLASHSENKMVGKDEDFEIIKRMLIEHSSRQREVVLIKGMGGIGKTTLARRIYEDRSIASHFDKRCWGFASQHHNKRKMLVGLLKSIAKQEDLEESSDEELALQLYQVLKHQRYLVVMDDVWSKEAWDAVKACFPNDSNRSRVLLTTRIADLANNIGSNDNFSHQMELLDQSESWDLFREKACRSRGVEFEKIGRPIVEKCKGLPLAIVVVAGLFSKLNTLDEWKNIAETLYSSATTTIDEECSRIFSLSYNHLPYNLKACFLYLGVFPEDYEINANDLARLWFAEGLVKAFKNESFDAMAKRYIQELIDRNLILVSERSCCGRKIKAFRMHDFLHAFCQREAQNENLLHVVQKNDSNFSQKGFRWVSIQSVYFNIPALYSSSKNCRSIFCFSSEASLKLKIFNMLRVLYFTSPSMHWEIVDTVLLRHLPPDSIYSRNLKLYRAWNLQTLYIYADDERNYLEFPHLKYFHCYSICRHPLKFVHQNLQSISTLEPYHCTEEFFTKIPYVKKVRIHGERRDCNDCIENLVCLQQLERLDIDTFEWPNESTDIIPINDHIVLLENLKKLSFISTRFEWKGIGVLSKLPRLEVLKVYDFACVGEEWELEEEEIFCQLICLEIGSTNLKHWEATACHFPTLERLVLYRNELEEIPADFAEISTLKLIKLAKCLPSAVTSAKQIEEEQLDSGNESIVVIVEDTVQPDKSDEEE